jgi:acetyl-CoA C-acetyltransferase
MDPRTPVLVGAGAIEQRADDPADAMEPVELMVEAARQAASPELLRRADVVLVPRGMWRYRDPGRSVAAAIDAKSARTVMVEIGVLQTTLVAAAASRIARGDVDVALIVGGEARHRAQTAKRLGVDLPEHVAQDDDPDERLQPAAEIMSMLELERGLGMPVTQYSVIDNALRAAEGISVAEHRRQLAELQAAFSAVAHANPHAWDRSVHSADEVLAAPTIGFPYSKLHTSQWNVDQAGALVLCSAGAAEGVGVPRDRWVFPVAVAESNLMVPLSHRAAIDRCPAVALAGRELAAHAGVALDEVEHLDIYSCFPSAVRLQIRELGIPSGDRPLTLTGGMRFAGGPLNNYVLQSTARAIEVLREAGGSALVTAISGLFTKQGLSLWSATPPDAPFAWIDVTEAATAETATVEVDGGYTRAAVVHGYTVVDETKGIVIASTPAGVRTIAVCDEPGVVASMLTDEWTGRAVAIPSEGQFTVA